jgi:hypothetical protein
MSSVAYLQLRWVKNSASPWIRSYAFVYMLIPCPVPDVIQPHVFTPKNTFVQENVMAANRTALIDKLDT